jgi:hypothetical protein
VLLSTTNADVLEAAETLGEELRAAQADSTGSQFDSLVAQCNDEINDEIALDYSDACETDGCC